MPLIEYFISTYNILMLILHSNVTQNVAALAGFNVIFDIVQYSGLRFGTTIYFVTWRSVSWLLNSGTVVPL